MLTDEQKQMCLAAVCVAILVFVAFFGAYAGITSSSHTSQTAQDESPPRENGSEERKRDKKVTSVSSDAPSPVLQINCNPNCSANSAEQQRDTDPFSRFIGKFREDPIELVTTIIAGANILLAVFIVIQIRDGRQASLRQLRAYVLSDSANVVAETAGQYIYIDVVIKNFGSTPAYRTSFQYETDIRSKISDDHILPFSNKSVKYKGGIIGPQHTNTVRIKKPEMTNFTPMSGKYVYVWGRVDYVDAFGNARCMTYQFAHDFGKLTSFGICPAGNEAN